VFCESYISCKIYQARDQQGFFIAILNYLVMNQLRAIAQLGNPVLRQQAEAVEEIQDPQLQQLIDDLIVTAQNSNGVGIAAPQVSASCRLFIVASRPSARYPYAPMMEPTAMINPRIVAHSDEVIKICLQKQSIKNSSLKKKKGSCLSTLFSRISFYIRSKTEIPNNDKPSFNVFAVK
jgi:hypothetical protein